MDKKFQEINQRTAKRRAHSATFTELSVPVGEDCICKFQHRERIDWTILMQYGGNSRTERVRTHLPLLVDMEVGQMIRLWNLQAVI